MAGRNMPVLNFCHIFNYQQQLFGKRSDINNHCFMDLGQKVSSGEYTLAHPFTHALNHLWNSNDVTCLFSYLWTPSQSKWNWRPLNIIFRII